MMGFSLNRLHRANGTRFKVYVQSPVLPGFKEPESIYVSSPSGSVGPGPEDDRMYAILPIDKTRYGDNDEPPYIGRCAELVLPDAMGNFDYLSPDDPGFKCTNMFATVRRVLDVWEIYLGGTIPFVFEPHLPKLELIAHVPWNNAHFGWGYMEFGEGKDDQGVQRPYALNFDVLAHEVGHCILFSLIGMPRPETLTTAFRGWQESACDTIAMLSALHFDSFLDHVLWSTKGNVYTENVMSRIGELSGTRQIRSASNGLKMKDVVSLSKQATQATHKEIHKLAQPMTGAIFDVTVKMFLRELRLLGLIPADYAKRARKAAQTKQLDTIDHAPLTESHAVNHDAFKEALGVVRDAMGLTLAAAWSRMDPNGLSYRGVVDAILAADQDVINGRNRTMFVDCMRWRGIIA